MPGIPDEIRTSIAHAMPAKVIQEVDPARDRFGGRDPLIVLQPESGEQIQEVVKICAGGHVRIVPRGGCTQMLDVAAPGDDRPVVVVSTRGLRRVVDYPQRDLTITAQSGMTCAELAGVTHPRGEHLALDPPLRHRATLGGIVATNAAGPRQLLHGPVAHHLLAQVMVLANGELIKAGARTVKNVAGYDLHKLYIGSFGSIGIITQVTLRLKPLAEALRLAEVAVDGDLGADAQVRQISRGETRPVLMTLLNPGAAEEVGRACPRNQLRLLVGFEGDCESVNWQIEHLLSCLGRNVTPLNEPESRQLYDRLIDWPARDCDIAFEVLVPGFACAPAMRYLTELGFSTLVHAGSGVVLACGNASFTAGDLKNLRQHGGEGCSIKFHRLPPSADFSFWAGIDAPRRWMRRLKQVLDPRNIFPLPGFLYDDA